MDSDRRVIADIESRRLDPPDDRPLCSTCGDREEQSHAWMNEHACSCPCHGGTDAVWPDQTTREQMIARIEAGECCEVHNCPLCGARVEVE